MAHEKKAGSDPFLGAGVTYDPTRPVHIQCRDEHGTPLDLRRVLGVACGFCNRPMRVLDAPRGIVLAGPCSARMLTSFPPQQAPCSPVLGIIVLAAGPCSARMLTSFPPQQAPCSPVLGIRNDEG